MCSERLEWDMKTTSILFPWHPFLSTPPSSNADQSPYSGSSVSVGFVGFVLSLCCVLEEDLLFGTVCVWELLGNPE